MLNFSNSKIINKNQQLLHGLSVIKFALLSPNYLTIKQLILNQQCYYQFFLKLPFPQSSIKFLYPFQDYQHDSYPGKL